MTLFWDEKVITFNLYLHAETTEGIWDNSEILYAGILDTDTVAAHRCHTYKGAYLNHVGQDCML